MAGVCSIQAMAASASVAQLGSASNGVMASSKAEFTPLKMAPCRRSSERMVGTTTTCQAASSGAAKVPDMGKRKLMNLLLLGAVGLPAAEMIGPYLYFLVPPGSGAGSAGVNAKDALGNDITEAGWLKSHPPGDRTLSQGLKGDPTYLVVESNGTLGKYGVNAVCTHLGCVVPYNPNEKKFICPCHGSQYNNQGQVVRGPAPLSLALAHVNVDEGGVVVYSPWTETDFRNGEKPWWA